METEKTSEDTKNEVFRTRFVEAISKMGDTVYKDTESKWLIGSLAAKLVSQTNTQDWVGLKRSMTQTTYNELLNSFRKQGNELAAKGNDKAAFAVEVLALSIIAPQMRKDEHIAAGDDLLNKMVQETIVFFRTQSADQQNPSFNKPN